MGKPFRVLNYMSDDELYQYTYSQSEDPDAVVIMKMRWNRDSDRARIMAFQAEIRMLKSELKSARGNIRALLGIKSQLKRAVSVSEQLVNELKEEVQHEWERLILTGRPSERPQQLYDGIELNLKVADQQLLRRKRNGNAASKRSRTLSQGLPAWRRCDGGR